MTEHMIMPESAPQADLLPELEAAEEQCPIPVMAAFELQPWSGIYEPEIGFVRGTIFSALDLPFIGKGACLHE